MHLPNRCNGNGHTFYGKQKFVIMFSGLQIEMNVLRSIGTLLKDSGWTRDLVEAGVASSGIAESYISVSDVARTCRIHQVTACCIYMLQKEAYYFRDENEEAHTSLSWEDLCAEKKHALI